MDPLRFSIEAQREASREQEAQGRSQLDVMKFMTGQQQWTAEQAQKVFQQRMEFLRPIFLWYLRQHFPNIKPQTAEQLVDWETGRKIVEQAVTYAATRLPKEVLQPGSRPLSDKEALAKWADVMTTVNGMFGYTQSTMSAQDIKAYQQKYGKMPETGTYMGAPSPILKGIHHNILAEFEANVKPMFIAGWTKPFASQEDRERYLTENQLRLTGEKDRITKFVDESTQQHGGPEVTEAIGQFAKMVTPQPNQAEQMQAANQAFYHMTGKAPESMTSGWIQVGKGPKEYLLKHEYQGTQFKPDTASMASAQDLANFYQKASAGVYGSAMKDFMNSSGGTWIGQFGMDPEKVIGLMPKATGTVTGGMPVAQASANTGTPPASPSTNPQPLSMEDIIQGGPARKPSTRAEQIVGTAWNTGPVPLRLPVDLFGRIGRWWGAESVPFENWLGASPEDKGGSILSDAAQRRLANMPEGEW